MDIYLYKFSGTRILVDKVLENPQTLTGNLRDATNILYPELDLTASFNVYEYNYAYIPAFKRYYFITNIYGFRNNIYRISMSVDVLMSYSEYIRRSHCFVSRNEFRYDNYYVDDQVYSETRYDYSQIPLADFKVINTPRGGDFINYPVAKFLQSNSTEMTYMINVLPLDNVFDIQDNIIVRDIVPNNLSITYFVKITDMEEISSLLLGVNLPQVSGVSNLFQNLAEYVYSTAIFPFSLSDIEDFTTNVGFMSIGGQRITRPTDVSFLRMNNISRMFRIATKIELSDLNLSEDFTDYEPYTKFQLYVPMHGVIDIPIKFVVAGYCYLMFDVSLKDGSFTAFLTSRLFGYEERITDFVLTFNGKFSVNIDIGSTNNNEILLNQTVNKMQKDNAQYNLNTKRASNVGTGLTGAIGSFIKGAVNPLVGIVGGINTTQQAIQNSANNAIEQRNIDTSYKINNLVGSVPSAQIGNVNDMSNLRILNICFLIKSKVNVIRPDNYNNLFGRPFNQWIRLGELTGYTEVSIPRLVVYSTFGLDHYPTAIERDMLETTLISGIIL